MIRIRTIQASVRDCLYKKFDNKFKVLFESNQISSEPYFYVTTTAIESTLDDCYVDRKIQIDITYVPKEDLGGRYDRGDTYKMLDALDDVFRPFFYVENRIITVFDVERTVIDNCGHYIFTIQFTDNFNAKEGQELEFMSELTVTLKGDKNDG